MAKANLLTDVYVVAAYRTAVGSFYGNFNDFSAPMLGAAAIRACLDDLNIESGRQVSQVIMGQVATGGPNPTAHTAALADIPSFVPTQTVNNYDCASGLKAVLKAYDSIRFGTAKLVVCGGQENLTMAPQSMYVPPGSGSFTTLPLQLTTLVEVGFTGTVMRERANQLAARFNIPRAILDKYAHDSIQKATKAMQESYFNQEIVIVRGCSRDETLINKMPTTLEMLMRKRTLLDESPGNPSTVTDGNSADMGDGAAVLVLCNRTQITKLRKFPLAKIVAFAEVMLSPDNFGIGSAAAIHRLLEGLGWPKESVDLFEIQEVFAVQPIIVTNMLQIDPLKVNISGGALALGHPVGASSARMLVTLIYNLLRLNLRRGIAAVCNADGMALAVAVEKVDAKEIGFVSHTQYSF